LLGAPNNRNEVVYDCCPDDIYPDITFTIYLQRRTIYYFNNLILPCLLIGILNCEKRHSFKLLLTASLAILGFYFPPESGEKVTLEITWVQY